MTAVFLMSLFSFLTNIPVGVWREHYKRLSLPWILIVHVSVPAIIVLRLYLEANPYFIPLFIALAISGQYLGKRIKLCMNRR